MPKISTILPPLFAACFFLVLWQALIMVLALPPYLVPSPIAVGKAFLASFDVLMHAFWRTVVVAIIGLGLSAIAGLAFSLMLSLWSFLDRAFYPYLVIFQAVPIITIAPLVVIWFGSGFAATTIIAWISSVVPVIASTVTGIRATPLPLLDLFRLQQASLFQTYWQLRLPFALPYFFSGLRIAGGLAVVGAIIGEYMIGMGGQSAGLGFVIAESAARLDVPVLFAATLLSCLLGAFFFLMIAFLEKHFLFWHRHTLG
jgi:NitT/TauT family transport system permease protein